MPHLDDPAPILTAPIAIEGFVHCTCCRAILGYRARVERVKFVYVYAYPPAGPRSNMASRRVNARIQAGDINCAQCGQWVEVSA